MNSAERPERTRPGVRQDPVARNAVFGFASQVATAAFTAGLTLYLVRALDPAGYGVFALAVAFSSLVLLPADFGITGAAARFIAERRDDAAAVGAVLVMALRIKLALTSALSILLALLADPIASAFDAPDLAWPLRAIALALLGQSVMMLFMSTFVALGRVAMQFRLVFSESAVEATASVVLVLFAGGATAAAAGRAVGFVFGGLLGAVLAVRLLGRDAFANRHGGVGARKLAGYAGALLVIDGAFAVFSQVDVLLVGALLGTGAAGIYGAPAKLVTLLHYPGLAISNAVAPKLARTGTAEPDVEGFVLGLRYVTLLQGLFLAVIVAWADPIVAVLLGEGYDESAAVLRALAPFVFMKGLGPLLTVGINYLGEARRRVPIALAAVVINLGLAFALIEEMGVVGAAVSVDVAYAIYLGAHLWVCRRLLDLPLLPLAKTTLRTLAAAGAMAGVMLLFGTADLNVFEWAAGLAGGAVAFWLALVVLRELRRGELRWVASRFRRGFARPQ